MSKNNDINNNSKKVIMEQPTKSIINESSKKEQTDFNWCPLTISISDPALNATRPQIHSDSKAQEDCCLCCACFICFIPAMVIDTISCPARLCYNKLF